MPSGKNWTNFIYVNLAFAIYIAGVFYYSQLAAIKANWPLYRCNPMYMPLADDVETNFVYCIQNMQSDFMGYLLEPLTFLTSFISSILGNFTNDINMVRAMFNKVRTFLSSTIQSVFGVFLSLMYVIDGSILTMSSTWNGPPGQMVRVLGKCFDPETKVKLQNGNIKMMKDIDLGDTLENGSIVESVMKIDNKRDPVPFYIIKDKGVNKEDIYVTGSHLIFNDATKEFCKVEDYINAELSDKKTYWFSCLITSDHKIQIGDEVFWDWEDHFLKLKK